MCSALVAAILYFAKEVFIPIALALLFTFLLAPLVIRFQKWKLPKPLAIVGAVTMAFALVACVTWLVSAQLLGLAEQLPNYEKNLRTKVSQLRGTQGPGVFSRATGMLKNLVDDFEAPKEEVKPEPGTPG